MKFALITVFIVSSLFSFSQTFHAPKLKKGSWISELQLNEKDNLPFDLVVEKQGNDFIFTVMNGEERIILNTPRISNDTFYVSFPVFDSELIFTSSTKKKITGYWYNYSKGKDYKISFHSEKKKSNRFVRANKAKDADDFSGKWRVAFMPGTESEYPALGVFNQTKNELAGTFLTETGDYRFLAGNAINDSMFLSCFDGSHAFLFKAQLKNDSLYGTFLSGNHWKSSWHAIKDSSYMLKDPEKLTFVQEGKSLDFSLPTLNNETFNYPNETLLNKVVIIQIMGSWCPNCLDETVYFKELYSKYHDLGLEIVSIGYENGDGFDDYKKNLERLKTKLDLDFTFLIGGAAKKNIASQHFDMLNEIISFPTTIFIGRDGEIKKVHTGFSGPGTGTYYNEYVKKTNALIESLLAN